MIDYRLLNLFRLKFKDDLDLQDENLNFLLNCYNRFLNQSCNDRHLKNEDRYKKIKKIFGMKFILKKENEKIKEFTFSFIKNKRLLFSLTGIIDNSLFKLEEYYSDYFCFYYGTSKFKIDFIDSNGIGNITVYSHYNDKSLNDASLIYKYFGYKEKDYLISKKDKIFNIKYHYVQNLENTFIYSQILYFKEFNNLRFIVRKYANKEYVGENSISKSLIYYLNCVNKNIEDIIEDDLKNVIILNYQ
jgi:hypothetical protein